MTNIIGIDPGSNITGYGIIKVVGKNITYVDSGVIRVVGKSLEEKLRNIFHGLSQIVTLHKPDAAAVERIFMHANVSSALKLGEARGVALAALAVQNVQVNEYSARQVKQAIVGFGAAQKHQMQHMVKVLLKLDKVPPKDAADALAIAICHANHSNSILAKLGGGSKGLPRSWRKIDLKQLKIKNL